MTLRAIRITHIKGIQNKTFNLNIIPNKPSLLYAPNGFGKSSLAIAFESLKTKKIELHNDNLYKNDDANRPRLELTVEKGDGAILTVVADDTTNTISTEFDCYVINNQVRAKGVRLRFGGRTNFSTSLAIDSVSLIEQIPPEQALPYSILPIRQNFGHNGKVLPNLNAALNIPSFVRILSDQLNSLERLCGVRNQSRLSQFRNRLNQQDGTTEQILDWIENNELVALDSIEPLQTLTDLLMPLDLGFTRRSERILAVLQMLDLYQHDKAIFKRYLDRSLYEFEKNPISNHLKCLMQLGRISDLRRKMELLLLSFLRLTIFLMAKGIYYVWLLYLSEQNGN